MIVRAQIIFAVSLEDMLAYLMIVRVTIKATCHTAKAPCIDNPDKRGKVLVTEVARENIFSKDVTVVNLPTSSVRQPTNHVHEICKSNEDDGEIVRWVICEALKSCRQGINRL